MNDTLEYRAPEPSGGQVARFIGQLALWYAQYFAVMFVMTLVVPRFQAVFQDFHVSLSEPTVVLLLAARLCRDHALWLWLAPLPAIFALLIAPPWPRQTSARSRRGWRLIATLLMACFLLFLLYALGTPLVTVVGGLSNTK
jgi:hypothetical protein